MLPPLQLLAADTPPREGGSPSPDASEAAAQPSSPGLKVDDLLSLDIDQLSKVRVNTTKQPSNVNAPSTQINANSPEASDVSTTGELARQAPSVSTRRTSAINLDPRVRGYHSGQLNATANGMNEVKTRLDIDSVFSQIDPGVVDNLTVIDGPYTAQYGPGFAFLVGELLPVPRFANGPEAHEATTLQYGSNGQALYSRETVLAGGKAWGVLASYGLRIGNDYWTGGPDPYRIPSSYQKWDGLLSVSKDLSPITRLRFDYLRCEMNDVELPGVVYDINNSTNDQFNLRYIVQEDPQGPRDFQFQVWHQETHYQGDSLHTSKHSTFYDSYITLPLYGDDPANTFGRGRSDSTGARLLGTLGGRDEPQWTVGADYRRLTQVYRERSYDALGNLVLDGGDVFGLPKSQSDDFGLLSELMLPFSDAVSVNLGGRLDYCQASVDATDPVVTYFDDPTQAYYAPGFNEPSKLLGMAYLTTKTKLDDRWTLNAGSAFAMRMPDLAELYGDDPYVPAVRFGNSYASGFSTLAAEKDLQFDLGLTATDERISYGVRGFYALVWDYITLAPGFVDIQLPPGVAGTNYLGRNFDGFPVVNREDLANGYPNADVAQAGCQYTNVELATLAGGDLFAEVQLRKRLSVYVSMAYVRGTNWHPVQYVAADSLTASEGQFVPLGHPEGLPNIYPFNTTVAFRLFEPEAHKWLVEFSTRIVGTQDYVAESLGEVAAPGYVTCALRGHYRVNEHLRFNMALENLFNQYYTEPGSLAIIGPNGVPVFVREPGFSAIVGMEARF